MIRAKKKELRERMRKVLGALDRRWLRAASKEICDHITLFLNDSAEIENTLFFLAHFYGECNLSRCLSEQLKSRAVYLPRCSDYGSMSFYKVNQDWAEQLESGFAGLREPKAIPENKFDLSSALDSSSVIFVPGLAFGRDGSRLGRGFGFYDRFFEQFAGKSKALIKIGVCFEIQIVPDIPFERHDYKMDLLVTERGIVPVPA
ncbi:MAG TPA: 5-formyltetrahydrofolate cyclo-ligase [Oligoflexia bacterium]|nr:5-formyltetrahydrofolate cyclo-ligase [Oligoflexia bacterium]HMP26677.1 5-formyltetrahydrofolate cyclo-ligase [Oligoflexia bacterium]